MVKDFAARSEIRQVLRSVIKHIVPVITDYDELTFERMLLGSSFRLNGDDSVGQSTIFLSEQTGESRRTTSIGCNGRGQ